jgi:hypothetical protein
MYEQSIAACVYNYHITGSGSISGNEYDFQYTSEYTVSGGVGCEFIPLCVTTGTTHGVRIGGTFIGHDQSSDAAAMPVTHTLFQNYPNPFNPETTITYALPEAGRVRVEIYNVLGQVVKVLVDGEREAGYHSVQWDASNMVSGIYLYRLVSDSYRATKQMVLMK